MKAILTYHSIDHSGSVISVAPAVFEQQVRWLATSRVKVVGLTDLLDLSDDGDAIAITFDDAFTNFKTDAWPRLKEHDLPATVFVPTGFVGRNNGWAAMPGGDMPIMPILDWASLAELQEEGATLGAHSRTHADLRLLSDAAVEDEVLGSIDDIQRETGRRVGTFAYPYGYWSASAARVAARVCSHACTTELRPLSASEPRHLLPRLDMYYLRGWGRLESFGSASFRAYVGARAQVRAVGQWVRARVHA